MHLRSWIPTFLAKSLFLELVMAPPAPSFNQISVKAGGIITEVFCYTLQRASEYWIEETSSLEDSKGGCVTEDQPSTLV